MKTQIHNTEAEVIAILKDFDKGEIDEDDLVRLLKQEVGMD